MYSAVTHCAAALRLFDGTGRQRTAKPQKRRISAELQFEQKRPTNWGEEAQDVCVELPCQAGIEPFELRPQNSDSHRQSAAINLSPPVSSAQQFVFAVVLLRVATVVSAVEASAETSM